MKLKRLEISGFKSFRDKVVVDFSKGVNAVVGPNGCGKSNVVDAIRWVMGEQRVKALRGKKMDDVVFNGSEDSAAVSVAEVVMTLDGDGSTFPGAYGELTEISISRKVVLDGDSEYCLNRVPCRLLDIKEFFMGTGVGARTYSLVEQGSVSNLVEAKPEDRRLFIEDAAGVSKYKSRKEAAVRKMEATKQNILRLNDINKEVKSQLNAISRQAKRAEQYKEIKLRMKDAELLLSKQAFAELAYKDKALQSRRDEARHREDALVAHLEAKESALEEMKASLLESEERMAQSQAELYEIKSTINVKETSIDFSRRQIADSTGRKQKNLAEIEALQGKESELIVEIEKLQQNAAEAFSHMSEMQDELDAGNRKSQELIDADRQINGQLEEHKILYMDIITQKARFSNMVSSLAKSIEDLKKREERESREIEEDKKRLDELTARLQSLRDGLVAQEDERGALADQKEAVAEELEQARTDLQLIDERIAQIKEETGSKSSRVQSLIEFQEAYKWSSDGVKQVIETQDSADTFYGVVADHIQVPREYESAVEAVLGDKLQYVVVKNQEDGLRAIDYLKSYRLGRGSFVPVELRAGHATTYSNEHLQEAEPLLRKVSVQDEFRQIADCLLGDVLLTPTIQTGIQLWKQNGFCGTFVTPEGDTISPHGVLTGGSGSAVERSLLATKREIAELEAELIQLANQLEENIDEKKKLASAITRWDEELSGLKNRTHQLEIEINSRKKDIERFDDETGRLTQRIASLEFNRQNIKEEIVQSEEKYQAISADAREKEEKEKELNEIISALNSRKQQSRVAIDEHERLLTGQKVRLASLAEKKEADLRTIARLQNDIQVNQQEVSRKREEIDASDVQMADLSRRVEEEQNALQGLYANYAQCEATLVEKKAEQAREDEKLKAGEQENREIKRNLDELRRQMADLEMQCREVALNIENLQKAILEKHSVALADLMADFTMVDETQIEEQSAKLEKDRQTIETFGEVNLMALSEYEELDKRYQFLTEQLDDLNASLASLQRTITRINKISRDRFSETFAAVNNCFKEVFAQIFPGGRGELHLTDENDLLETGVDIDIQIPGKKSQSVSLLSGGEKSLAAIALIFAILMYRPSPFLILDEVDAALDDANTNLFNRLIKNVSDKSQVIMITHNKSTMEVADTLFGVTMQKQGISSLVSVSLN
ncbi:MAG: chromosome segregation protein SMC [Smithellaceae bacterium]